MDKPEILSVRLGPIETNCYVVGDEHECLVIDPGWFQIDELDKMIDNRRVEAVVATHGHYDHIAGVDAIRNKYRTKLIIHEEDAEMVGSAEANLSSLFGEAGEFRPAEETVKDGDTLSAAGFSFKVLHTPGHTRGGICLYTDGILFCGDTIFAFGVGRTDFPGGSYDELRSSIREKIFPLPDETRIYPGHDDYGMPLAKRKGINI